LAGGGGEGFASEQFAQALAAGCSADATPAPQRVSLEEGRQLFESKQVVMFDIREPDEHATGVANGARLLPMSQLNQRAGEIPKDPAQPVLIICNTQNRSSKVVQAMKDAGWNNVRYVNGGMSDWAQKGWPMVKPFGLPKS
jgi:rhodanese-related sulfurtransferase